jgi:hypothetical protein
MVVHSIERAEDVGMMDRLFFGGRIGHKLTNPITLESET